MEYDMDTIKAIAKHLDEYHSDHEFILIPDDLKYEVIKNDTYESTTTFGGCEEALSDKQDSGMLPAGQPKLWTGDTHL
jgi:hypothetical protein